MSPQTYDREYLEKLSRSQLQNLAKKHKIKANAKSATIVEQLLAVFTPKAKNLKAPLRKRARRPRDPNYQYAIRTFPKRKVDDVVADAHPINDETSVHEELPWSDQDEIEDPFGRSSKRVRMDTDPDSADPSPETDFALAQPDQQIESIQTTLPFHAYSFIFELPPGGDPVANLSKVSETADAPLVNRRIRVVGPGPPKSPPPVPRARINSMERDIFGFSDHEVEERDAQEEGEEVHSNASSYTWSAAAADAESEEKEKALKSLTAKLYNMPYREIVKIDKRVYKKAEWFVDSREERQELEDMLSLARDLNNGSQIWKEEIVASRLALEDKIRRWKKCD